MTETTRCPGNELNKNLKVFTVKCQKCGKENEIFADEINKAQKCSACNAVLDVSGIAK